METIEREVSTGAENSGRQRNAPRLEPQAYLLDLVFAYNPSWLRFGLEVVFGEYIVVMTWRSGRAEISAVWCPATPMQGSTNSECASGEAPNGKSKAPSGPSTDRRQNKLVGELRRFVQSCLRRS